MVASTKIIFIDWCALIFREPFIYEKGQGNKKQKNCSEFPLEETKVGLEVGMKHNYLIYLFA